MTEKQIEKIRETIKVFRSRLAGEKRRFGNYFDSGGVRYIIPELYIKLGDYKGALNYFNWFDREFPGDPCYPAFHIFRTATLFHQKRFREAERSAYRTAFSNTYLLDLICNKTVVSIDKSELTGSESLGYAKETSDICNKLVSKEFRSWICRFIETEEFRADMNKFISLQKLIKDEPAGSLRSELIDESSKMEKRLTERDDE